MMATLRIHRFNRPTTLRRRARRGEKSAFQYDKWNRFTIKAQGHRLQTWVNGIPCADYTDTDPKDFTPRGFIALQVHGGKGWPAGAKCRWRNIRIRRL